MSINNRAPASGELLKTDGSIINQADVLSDVYDAEAHAVKTVLQAEGVTFEVNEADLTAVREAVEAQARLTDTQPVSFTDDPYAIYDAPSILQMDVSAESPIALQTGAQPMANRSRIEVRVISGGKLAIGFEDDLTATSKSEILDVGDVFSEGFQVGSTATVWAVAVSDTVRVSVKEVPRRA